MPDIATAGRRRRAWRCEEWDEDFGRRRFLLFFLFLLLLAWSSSNRALSKVSDACCWVSCRLSARVRRQCRPSVRRSCRTFFLSGENCENPLETRHLHHQLEIEKMTQNPVLGGTLEDLRTGVARPATVTSTAGASTPEPPRCHAEERSAPGQQRNQLHRTSNRPRAQHRRTRRWSNRGVGPRALHTNILTSVALCRLRARRQGTLPLKPHRLSHHGVSWTLQRSLAPGVFSQISKVTSICGCPCRLTKFRLAARHPTKRSLLVEKDGGSSQDIELHRRPARRQR